MKKHMRVLLSAVLLVALVVSTACFTRKLTTSGLQAKKSDVPRISQGSDRLQENTELAKEERTTALTNDSSEEEPAEAIGDPIEPFAQNANQLICGEDLEKAPVGNGHPYYIKVNRTQNVVTVYGLDSEGYYRIPLKAFVCSVGKNNGTPTGTFYTSDKHEWGSLTGGVWGQYAYRIDGHIMFHSVPYFKQSPDTLETEEYNKLGEAASLGCVRLSVSDAKWIFENCPAGTMVTIYDSEYPGPLGKPVAEKLKISDEKSVWDPTDPDDENPWRTENPRILGAGERKVERGYTYQPACGVIALDESGKDITEDLRMEGFVNAMVAGEYPVTYTVSDKFGRETKVQSVIKVVDTIAPEVRVDKKELTLNKQQASAVNLETSVREAVTALDLNREIPDSYISVEYGQLGSLESGRYNVSVTARDQVGNISEPVEITLILDMVAPEIHAPENRTYEASSAEDLLNQLKNAISVTDDYSGVDDVEITWVYSRGSYHVLVTAKDGYGNVETAFFDDFQFHGHLE